MLQPYPIFRCSKDCRVSCSQRTRATLDHPEAVERQIPVQETCDQCRNLELSPRQLSEPVHTGLAEQKR
ncbi:hypothetical protein L798_05875 [Zootermopsis nevadensis]|uniref:Uncharacterized protein n=1 Tax=Zootermopsis nevadensis TaxID=136037 RepID=A0A067R8S5_ZOONE|nr:hypothetical protein L798_05875 [Zootermopsis nevadensis]